MSDSVWIGHVPERQIGLACPHCGAEIEACAFFSLHSFKGPAAAMAGSLGMCGYCGGALRYTESFASFRTLSVRPATAEEVEAWFSKSPKHRRLWSKTRAMIKKRAEVIKG